MSNSLYHTYDEGYVGDTKGKISQSPLDGKEEYLADYEDRFVARFTEDEIITVIQGTRAEFRLQLKQNKKKDGAELRRIQQELEQVLEEERMLSNGRVAEQENILTMARVTPPTEEEDTSNDTKYESLQTKLRDLNSLVEFLKGYRDMTEESVMEIREHCEDFDHTVMSLERRKNAVIDDFMETDSSCKKWVRKCREMTDVVYRSVERVENTLRQIEKKQRTTMDEEIRYTEYLVQAEEEIKSRNTQHEEITKSSKQELTLMNAQVKRKKMELHDLETRIGKAEQEHAELKTIADELMVEMNRTY